MPTLFVKSKIGVAISVLQVLEECCGALCEIFNIGDDKKADKNNDNNNTHINENTNDDDSIDNFKFTPTKNIAKLSSIECILFNEHYFETILTVATDIVKGTIQVNHVRITIIIHSYCYCIDIVVIAIDDVVI